MKPFGNEAGFIWQALRSCGLKQQITWEDAVEEAKLIERESNQRLSELLFAHLEKAHQTMGAAPSSALAALRQRKWVLARRPVEAQHAQHAEPEAQAARMLHSLSELFPASQFHLVWAVAPTVHPDLGTAALLVPGKSVGKAPEILVSQLDACARAAPYLSSKGLSHPRLALGRCLKSILAVFEEIFRSHRAKATQLLRCLSVAYLPCLADSAGSAGAAGTGAALFEPRSTALRSAQSHVALSPALGILYNQESVRGIGVAMGVPEWPAVEVLKEAIPSFRPQAVALCAELAAGLERLKPKERPAARKGLKVPTNSGKLLRVEDVYINDAPWSKGKVETLDEKISSKDARLLGCTSVRDQLAKQCEDANDEDAFGQEADLVDQIALLLKDYSGRSDVVAEFVQNTDDFGASELKFVLSKERHVKDRVVDKRCENLQGPALYICSNKPLGEEDILRMQKVGGSAKQFEFASTGRFGVGLNVMYRYSECPQLCANGRLHFFDVSRSFVAREGQRRGKQYDLRQLQENFPDSLAPFEAFRKKYPVVFRLPLRTQRSKLGEAVTPEEVQRDLQQVAEEASSMLLFAKWLRSIRLETSGAGTGLICQHTVSMDQAQEKAHQEFFNSLPTTVQQVSKLQKDMTVCVWKRIASSLATKQSTVRAWVVVYNLALSSEPLRTLCRSLFDKALGGALLPLAAAAAPEDLSGDGRVCCGLPTPMASGATSWISGTFILSSSRKVIPLTAGADSPDHIAWNLEMLKGPAAQSLKTVMLECRSKVKRAQDVDKFFHLLSLGKSKGVLESTLAKATFSAALSDAIFPVVSSGGRSGASVEWVKGPSPLLRTACLPEDVQDALAFDGLELATLPPVPREIYEACLNDPARELTAQELCEFLASSWAAIRAKIFQSVELREAGMVVLSKDTWVTSLLKFAMISDWHCRLQNRAVYPVHACEHLEGVPLLRTADGKLCAFGSSNLRFNTDQQLLPTHKSLFLHKDTMEALQCIDLTKAKIPVRVEAPGVRGLELDDLVPYRKELEAMAVLQPDVGKNGRLKHLWCFIAKQGKIPTQPLRIPTQLKGWKLLPVHGTGEEALVVSLDFVWQTVAEADAKIRTALLEAGVYLLQSNVGAPAWRLLSAQ
ncbi:unnamed protein product, partial [Effrenium voratum]